MTASFVRRILLFGDNVGILQLMRTIPNELICGLVGAEIRQQYHGELRDIAHRHNLPFLIQAKPSSSRYPAFVEAVRRLSPDLLMVNSYAMLLREEILSIPAFGAVNVHGALLPQYRGCNPIQWALLNNETETGVTMHYIAYECDSGDIIAQRRVPIHLEDTWCDVQNRIAIVTEGMLQEEVPKLLTQTNNRARQDETKARYYGRRKPEDGRFDWEQSVLGIYNLVRALVRPHPGAFCYDGGKKTTFDEYLPIQKVASLKYGSLGRRTLEFGDVRLAPMDSDESLPPFRQPNIEGTEVLVRCLQAGVQVSGTFEGGMPEKNMVMFRFHSVTTNRLIGVGGLNKLDYVSRDAELLFRVVDASDAEHVRDAVGLMLRFAFEEICLDSVYVHVPATGVTYIGLLDKVGFTRMAHGAGVGSAGTVQMGAVMMRCMREGCCV